MLSINDILSQVNELFRDVLENDQLNITLTTTAEDIEEWDSLSHIHLVVAVEKHFKIRFNSSEIGRFKNVGDMCEAVLRHLSR
jgi:acyl carrier protein